MNYSYIAAILALYFVRALFFEIGSFGANYFMTKVVQASIKDLRSALSQKINKIPISILALIHSFLQKDWSERFSP